MVDTNQSLQALLMATQGQATPFPPTSRYYGIATKTIQTADGRTVIYLSRRFVPSPDNFALLQYHTVTQGERLDNITAKYLNDPQQFWRICDANGAMRPDELTETVGRKIRITLPQGVPALPNA
jgi:hypothetical protein